MSCVVDEWSPTWNCLQATTKYLLRRTVSTCKSRKLALRQAIGQYCVIELIEASALLFSCLSIFSARPYASDAGEQSSTLADDVPPKLTSQILSGKSWLSSKLITIANHVRHQNVIPFTDEKLSCAQSRLVS